MHFQYGLNGEIYSTTKPYQIQLTIKHLKLSFHKFIYIPQFQKSSKADQFVLFCFFRRKAKINRVPKLFGTKIFLGISL